jgi:phosphatidylglycerol lysyltransferase
VQVLTAVVFALASYASLTLYDAIALRIVGRSLPYRRVALISFIASAVGSNLGLSSLSAGSVRMRAYTSERLSAGEVALVQGLATATFALGAGALLGMSSLLGAGRAASLLHVSGWAARLSGACLLGMLSVYVLCTALFRRPFRIRDWSLRLPSAPMTLGQIAVGALDICCAAGCLYALLPATTGAGPAAFVGSFVLAITLGALSNVPGGLGVLESALLLLLPAVDPADLLGAVVVFRAVYYVAPFGIALCVLGAQELTSLGRHVPRATSMGRRLIEAIAPQLLTMAVFGAGAVLLVSGALPAIGTRVERLRGWLPLPVLEISHLAGSAIGAALLILSRGLYRRMRGAFRLTQVLLAIGIAASLCKGIDYEEAAILVGVMLLLHGARGRFYRRAALETLRVSPLGLLNVGLVILAVIWLGLMAFRDVGYTHELFWQFAFDAEAPRMLRAASVIVLLGAGYGLWQLLKPAPPAS